MNDLVLFHASCYDGFGAAWAAWQVLRENAEYKAVSYGEVLSLDKRYDKVYILDFSYNEDALLRIKEHCNQIVLLDHHKTAEEMLAPLINKYPDILIKFDMNKSGAMLAWEYFNVGNAPPLIKCISDRDLWQFKIDGSKEVHAALTSYPMDFDVWNQLVVLNLIDEGRALLRMQGQNVKNILKNSFEIDFEGHKTAVVNTSVSWSEVGEALLAKHNTQLAISFTDMGDNIMFSVRSTDVVDSSALSKKYGGGGHKKASGFKLSRHAAYEVLGKRI